MTLPTRSLGSSGLKITTLGFGAWAIGGGDWAFGWGPSSWASTGSTPPLFTVSAILRKWSAVFCTSCLRPSAHSCSQNAVSSGTSVTAWWSLSGYSGQNQFGLSAKHRSAGWALNGSTYTSSTGRMRSVRAWRILGQRWCGSSKKEKCGLWACRTSMPGSSNGARRSITWIPSSHPSP